MVTRIDYTLPTKLMLRSLYKYNVHVMQNISAEVFLRNFITSAQIFLSLNVGTHFFKFFSSHIVQCRVQL